MTTTTPADLGNGWITGPDRKVLLWVSEPTLLSDGSPGGCRDLVRISRTAARRDGKVVPAVRIETADWWADDRDALTAGPDRAALLQLDNDDDDDGYLIDWSGVGLPVKAGLSMLVYALALQLDPDTWMDVAMKVNDIQLPRFDKETDELSKLIDDAQS